MNPDLWLTLVAALAGFALKTTLGFGVALLLSRLAASANLRFLIWSGFLYGSTGYWLFLAYAVFGTWRPVPSAGRAPVQAAAPSGGAWQIPGPWALPLTLVLGVLGIVYVVILIYMLLAHNRKRWRLKWVLGFTTDPPPDIAAAFQSLAESLHIRRSRLLLLSGAGSPATFGWLRPTILLPAFCLELDRSELEDILRHELHHVRRWDSAWNELSIMCRALLFFHPAAWCAVRKMLFDRELACDLAVVSQSPARKGKYAECLLRFARLNLAQDSTAWGIDFAAPAEHLTVRVHSILAASKRVPGWLLCLRAASGLALFALFADIAPSLAVVLSYAHQAIPQTAAAIHDTAAEMQSKAKPTRKARWFSSPASGSTHAAVAPLSQIEAAQPATELPADPTTANLSYTQASAGPQLLHRPAASGHSTDSNGTNSQTVALVDSDTSIRGREHGSGKQALQQSATAALAIYRRGAALDRH